MIDILRACEIASHEFKKRSYAGISEVREMGDFWIVSGLLDTSGKNQYGCTTIKINKETGTFEDWNPMNAGHVIPYYDSNQCEIPNKYKLFKCSPRRRG